MAEALLVGLSTLAAAGLLHRLVSLCASREERGGGSGAGMIG